MSIADKPKDQRGQIAENTALEYLLARGLSLIERNYHSRTGEIDLIMEDADTLVFVEVRYRKTKKFGSPLESITQNKQNHLTQCAQYYLSSNRINRPSRFDVVGISPNRESLDIEWIPNAFAAQI